MSEPKSINSKVSISAVIVVYNDYQSLSALIKSLCGQVDAIIVIDNSDADHVAPEFILDDVDIVYHRVGCNAGLGAGINKGIRLSEKKQSDWVLLLDQDSVVSENMTGCMMDEYYRSYEREKVGLICPDVFLKDKKSHQFPLRFGKILTRRVANTSDDVDFAITSGSMVKMSLFKETGFMDESFFIDYIDYDFCLRLRAQGYKILYVREAVLSHFLGERRLSSVGIEYTAHDPKRIYYQTRNRLIVVRRHGGRFPSFVLMQLSLFIFKFFKILILEDKKMIRLRYYFTGVFDSFRKLNLLT